jgi:hypothetical protein
MPVIGTQGALTYIRGVSLGPTWQSWYFEIEPTATSFLTTSTFDSNGNIYTTGAVSTNPTWIKIDTGGNTFATPYVAWDFKITGDGSGNALLPTSDGNILTIFKDTYNFPAPPGINVDTQFNTGLDSNTGNFLTPTKFYSPHEPATVSGGNPRREPKDAVLLSSGDYVAYGFTNQKPATAVNDFKTYLTLFDGNTGNITTQVVYGTSANVAGAPDIGNINLDSTGNIIFTTDTPNVSTIVKCDNALTTIDWQKQYNIDSIIDSCVDTNTDNIYFIGYVGSEFHMVSANSAGNVQWAKYYANSSGGVIDPGPSLINIAVNQANTSQLIVTGRRNGPTANTFPIKTYIASIHAANGEINWQRELTFTGSNTIYNNSYFETDALSTDTTDILLTGRLQRRTSGNVASTGGVLMKLPITGAIPSNGIYTLNANLSMTYTVANYTVSNTTVTETTLTNSLLTPLTSNFGDITLTSTTNIGANTYFTRL